MFNSINIALRNANSALSHVSQSSVLDAEMLLCHVLDCNRECLYRDANQSISSDHWLQYQALIKRREQGEPIAYIIGKKDFWTFSLLVDANVFIPRPETELLVESALLYINEEEADIIDMGTGSGALAMAIAKERPTVQVYASDESQEALAIAKRNAYHYQLRNIKFYHGDWYQALPHYQKFNMIISNPPYIAPDDPNIESYVKEYEPNDALFAENNGLEALKILIHGAPIYLKSKGYVLVEHGFNQKEAVVKYFKEAGFENIETILDLNGLSRVTLGRVT